MAATPVTVLAGGVGAARFLQGVLDAVPAERVTVVGNVGDDLDVHGLHVAPDLDTVLYTLAGQIDEQKGWGVQGDSDRALERARSLGADAWFWLGDLDIGLHLARTGWLAGGEPLSTVTTRLAGALGLGIRLLPATDDRLRTMVELDEGEVVDFQTYYVRRGHADTVRGLRFDGAAAAQPGPGVIDAIQSGPVVLAPSNPLISIGPILAVEAIAEALRCARGPRVAVSPIVAGRALRGPAADMMASLGHEVSPVGVARIYAGMIDALVIDQLDEALAPRIAGLGIEPVVTDTVMRSPETRRELARTTLVAAGAL